MGQRIQQARWTSPQTNRLLLEAAQNGGFCITNNPTGRLSTTGARTWTDNDRDFVVDCDLSSQAAQGPTVSGTVEACGVGSAATRTPPTLSH